MKTTWPKGVRDITTIQELRSRSVPSSREQIIIRLARLEREKARRARERGLWTKNQQQTDARLRATEERIDLLQVACEQMVDERADRRSPPNRDQADDSTAAWHAVVLEY